MHAAQWGGRRVPVCRRKEIKAPLFGCGKSVSLVPGKDYIPSLMIFGL